MTKLRVVIDARLKSGDVGGVEQVIIGLASGLSELTDGDEEYLFLTYSDSDEWIIPFLSGSTRVIHSRPSSKLSIKRLIRNKIPRLTKYWDNNRHWLWNRPMEIPHFQHELINHGIDVIHFPTQSASLTDIPNIYHPHDLQHVHLPEFFAQAVRESREIQYRTFCKQAHLVAVSSSWVKYDVMNHLGLPADKIKVIPLAPPLQAYTQPSDEELVEIRRRYSLPEKYLLYAAQTWPHKNHIGLLEAIALLRDKYGLNIHLILCGKQREHYPIIQAKIKNLKLSELVRFMGFINTKDLFGLYKLSRSVVIPTYFEAASFPMWEAFHAGVPVACSNITSLPEQAGGAAVLFDPKSREEMAEAILRTWTDEVLRKQLVMRGRTQLTQLTWKRTASIFRAHYRHLGGRKLSEDDKELINSE